MQGYDNMFLHNVMYYFQAYHSAKIKFVLTLRAGARGQNRTSQSQSLSKFFFQKYAQDLLQIVPDLCYYG